MMEKWGLSPGHDAFSIPIVLEIVACDSTGNHEPSGRPPLVVVLHTPTVLHVQHPAER